MYANIHDTVQYYHWTGLKVMVADVVGVTQDHEKYYYDLSDGTQLDDDSFRLEGAVVLRNHNK